MEKEQKLNRKINEKRKKKFKNNILWKSDGKI